MFAINHAATALLVKRRYPRQPIVPLLISVQLMELVWVALNYAGVERTTTDDVVRSVADVHLAYMPYSHSVATMVGVAAAAWWGCRVVWKRPELGAAVGLGIVSHLVLDLITHAPDIQLAPGIASPRLGLGLYAGAPLVAFVVELAYGAFCWWVYGGGAILLAVILAFNAANLSMLAPSVPGPEAMMAHRPLLIVSVILVQIVVTLALVGWFSRTTGRATMAG